MDVLRGFFAILIVLLETKGFCAQQTIQPSEVRVVEGETAMFSCFPNTIYHQIELHVNDEATDVGNHSRFSYYDVNATRLYSFHNVTTNDNGTTFKCFGIFHFSNISTLFVVVPPTITVLHSVFVTYIGANVMLSFEVTGTPFPTALWTHNGEPLNKGGDDPRIQQPRADTLSIQGALPTDAGSYTLTVWNYGGNESASTKLVVNSRGNFSAMPQDMEAKGGETVSLNCKHSSNTGYRWTANDSNLDEHSNPKVQIEYGGHKSVLTYGPLDYTDDYLRIQCLAILCQAEKCTDGSDVSVLTVYTKPHVVAATPLVEAALGTNVTMGFSIYGRPPLSQPPSVRHDSALIEPPAAPEGRVTLEGSNVVLRGVGKEDAGTYTLTAANEIGSGEASIKLIVHYPPKIDPLGRHPSASPNNNIISTVVAQLNTSYTLHCGRSVDALPIPTYSWSRRIEAAANKTTASSSESDSESESESDRGSAGVFLSNKTFLYFENVQDSDSGVYTCTVENYLGVDSTEMYLIAKVGLPYPPHNLTNTSVGPTWVCLSWAPPILVPLDLYLSNYRVSLVPNNQSLPECSQSTATNCSEVTWDTSVLAANVTGLVPSLQYSIFVVAYANESILRSDPSQAVNVTTLQTTPRIESVSVSVQTPANATVQWRMRYQGGHPVQRFVVSFKRVKADDDAASWQLHDENVSGDARETVVSGLVSSEPYLFRVVPVSELGAGQPVISEEILSHELGVPGQPDPPLFTGWAIDYTLTNFTVSKPGVTEGPILVTIVLLWNGTETSRYTQSFNDYNPNRSMGFVLPNVTYLPHLQVMVIVCNKYGQSEPSEPSNTAGTKVTDIRMPYYSIGIAVGAVMSLVDLLVIAAAFPMCFASFWESRKGRKERVKRLQSIDVSEKVHSLLRFNSIASTTTGMDHRSSPDGRSNSQVTASMEYVQSSPQQPISKSSSDRVTDL